jgi:hypothetical protein
VNAHQVINQAHSFKLSDRKGRRGAPVYEITAHIGGETHHVLPRKPEAEPGRRHDVCEEVNLRAYMPKPKAERPLWAGVG